MPSDTAPVETAEKQPETEPDETKADEAIAVAAEKEADTALDALMDDPESAKPARKRVKGKFAKEDTEEETETPESEVDTATDAEYQRAMAALKRDGYPDLDEYAKANPDKFREYGLKRAQVQNDLDELAQKHQSTSSELAEFKRVLGKDKSDSDIPAVTDQQLDVSKYIKPLADHFSESYGEDASQPLTTAFTGLATQLQTDFNAQLQQRDESHKEQLESLQGAFLNLQAESARKELLSEYPKLKNSDRWQNVIEHMNKVGFSEEQPDFLSLASYAAQIEFAPEMAKEAKAAKRAAREQRDQGVPTSPSTKRETDVAHTIDSVGDAMLDAQIAMEAGEPGAKERYEELKGQMTRLLSS